MRLRSTRFGFFVASILLSVVPVPLAAQGVETDPNFANTETAWSLACVNALTIDAACAIAESTNQTLFMIARPGTGETDVQLSWRRLYRIRCFIESEVSQPPPVNLSVGEPVRGVGRIEFYVGGKPVPHGAGVARVYAHKNRFFRLYETETPSPAQRRCEDL